VSVEKSPITNKKIRQEALGFAIQPMHNGSENFVLRESVFYYINICVTERTSPTALTNTTTRSPWRVRLRNR